MPPSTSVVFVVMWMLFPHDGGVLPIQP